MKVFLKGCRDIFPHFILQSNSTFSWLVKWKQVLGVNFFQTNKRDRVDKFVSLLEDEQWYVCEVEWCVTWHTALWFYVIKVDRECCA